MKELLSLEDKHPDGGYLKLLYDKYYEGMPLEIQLYSRQKRHKVCLCFTKEEIGQILNALLKLYISEL